MSLPSSGPPFEPPSGPPGYPPGWPPRGLADLRLSDMLLALVIGLGVTRFAGILVVALLVAPRMRPGEEPFDLQLLLVVVFTIQALGLIAAVYLFAVRRRGIGWPALGLRALPPGWFARAATVALIAFLLATLVNLAVQNLMDEPQRNPQLELIAPGGFSWSGLVITLIFVAALVPFAEELFFRGLVFGWLRTRMGLWPAAIISGLGFSVLHGVWWLIPALALLGVILALVYERSGSVWAATVTHGLFNSFTTIIYYAALAADIEAPIP